MRNKTFNMVFCSIISLMSFLALYLSNFLNVGELIAFGVSVLILCVTVAECGAKWGLTSGIVVLFLGLMFMPNKLILLPYGLYFWYYPVLKLYIEGLRKPWLEWILKVTSFSLAMLCVYFITGLIIPVSEISQEPIYITALLLEICFILFDIVLTQDIGFYLRYISKRINKKRT